MYTSIFILCEGPSEERFVKDLLSPYLAQYDVYLTSINLGGVSRYAGISRELKRIGRNSSCVVTTMLDYYGLPQDTPRTESHVSSDIIEIAHNIEDAMYRNLASQMSCKKFIPYIMMHEYEALLFTDIEAFSVCEGMTKNMISILKKETASYPSPEHINNSEQTAPSKRILRIYPQYQKVSDGILIAEKIGLEKMMKCCSHFCEWVEQLKNV